jgi:hypothetical protein
MSKSYSLPTEPEGVIPSPSGTLYREAGTKGGSPTMAYS